ncbi:MULTISPECIES: alpha/beta hydrolase [Mycolicibacterium]|uniref:Alpha/beta hydrolase n=1 Tax=Mycolicibacterium phocaicum TaxID=319706 RepID=A0A7I7ZMA3_9MYCO|nr:MULTISPECIES: alpha/beta fold hydrolase [Mycolicibacterium]MCX8556721.1 alpha/beta fold hydrolase [Mycolicibacterium mucogenicum]TLH67178.1 alpha/beta hydrolase [Mycolicibacterium phocaicum]BBZ55345.1 putative hydrolase, alpha/beta fold protein [Mycolicibacterium phocaicum]
MTSAIPVEQLDFASGGDRCAAWLTLPSSPGPHPAVVLVHGLGATRDMMLPQYEQHFAAAGIAVLSFDYRFTGASGGQPRQRISISEQCRDVGAAIDFLQRHPRVDAGRIGLWGTSLGGMNVVRVAGSRNDIAAAVVQCPITHGPASARSVGIWGALRLTPAIVDDAVRALLRRERRYVPIVGQPGTDALVTVAGAEDGWRSTVPAGAAFDNRITAVDAALLITRSALRHAATVQAPLLVCVCDDETLMEPRYAEAVADRAPRGIARHYASDHFAIYHPPLVRQVLDDQVAFLAEHL